MVQSGLKRYSGEEILKDMRLQIATAAWGPASMLPGRRELAKQYGVSTVTVGKAIDALVAEKMLRVDDRRGTFVAVPSGPAELPSAPRGLTVGVVGPLYLDHDSHSNQWFRQIVQAVEHEYSDEDRGSIFTNLVQNGVPIPLAEAVEMAIQTGIDGLVVIAIEHNPADIAAAIETTHRHGIPVVFITSTDIRLPVPHVSPDGFDAGYQAAQHVIRQGARRCSFFAPFHSWWTVERGNGIAAAWEQAGLDPKAVEKLPLDTTPWRKEQEPVEFGFTTASAAFAHG
ncbi:LacI family transcriptional regulator, partial [bacterium]